MPLTNRAYRFLAWCLLLVFTTLQAAQGLHVHKGSTAMVQVKARHNAKHAHLSQHAGSCHLCDYHHHSQTSYPPVFNTFTCAYFAPQPVILSVNYSQSIFTACVHTWTNKGPPATALA